MKRKSQIRPLVGRLARFTAGPGAGHGRTTTLRSQVGFGSLVASRAMTRRARLTGMLVAIALALGLGLATRADAFIYWADDLSGGGLVERSTLDGTSQNFFVFSKAVNAPVGVAVDSAHVYWGNTQTRTIGRAGIEGSTPFIGEPANDHFIPFAATGGLAVDRAHIYWSNGERIGRANLDGTGPTQSFIEIPNGSTTCPGGVAVDSTHIYFVSALRGGVVVANLNGTVVGFLGAPADCAGAAALAVDNAHVYTTAGGTIYSFNKDGSNLGQLQLKDATGRVISNPSAICGVASDGEHIYWTNKTSPNNGAGTIGRANLDGTNAETEFQIASAQPPAFPCGIAVDALPLHPHPTVSGSSGR